MPPKPQVFKAPDGKEFGTRAEWRDYMMLNFFSYKNKVNEPEPLVRLPGSIDGQMYDIGDCENSTLAVLDHSEQVQIDQCKGSKIFIAACASSIFIRNCENCVFYTCCRQLRLRDVVNCTFYIYSMAEVHIEFSKGLKFAPFNGGYPDHEKHLKAANLDINHNLWYDIYDHNDAAKSRVNWSLLPESEYEEPWFPLGPCTPAIPRTKPGGVFNPNNTGDANMQSFSLQQMINDSQKLGVSTSLEAAAAARIGSPIKQSRQLPQVDAAAPPPLPALQQSEVPVAPVASPAAAAPAAAPLAVQDAAGSDEDKVKAVLKLFVGYKAGEDISAVANSSFTMILPTGQTLSLQDLSVTASTTGNELWTVGRLHVAGDVAYASYWATEDAVLPGTEGGVAHCTAVLQREKSAFEWSVVHVQKSAVRPFSDAPPPYYA